MRAILSYQELEEYILKKYERKVKFAYVNGNSVKLTAVVKKVAGIALTASANITVNSVEDGIVKFSYDGGTAMNMMITGALLFMKEKQPKTDAFDIRTEDRLAMLNLNMIDPLQKALEVVDLKNVIFTQDEMVLNMAFKE
ncbi:MAG: hypothetical protein LKF31_00735 [Muribaculaceae bacterium]|jgi:hypothetical protein|nr:hypothetical protein [Muribaculaceae bacterium]